MNTTFTRRECLGLFASAAVLSQIRARAMPATASPTLAKPMRGAFMILNTPFTEAQAVDWDDLAREVDFVDRCGAQGIVWPQGSSGVATLTKEERMQGMAVLAKAARGRKVALVLGVQGKDTAEMLEYAKRAEALEPDAMIAMPPTTAKSEEDYREYFRALGRVTSRPVILQTTGGAKDLTPSTNLIVDLAREMPNFGYVKEESQPLTERMQAEIRQRPPMKSIFGANLGVPWLFQLRLGADGVITGNGMYADLMARIWGFHERGQSEQLRDAYSKFLLMRNLNDQIPGADLFVMKKRGVFKTTVTRGKKQYEFSPQAIAEIEFRFAALKPYLQDKL
jgi:dihydrodipicolinate synthase/N-acetylneuraminate lyase